MIAIIDYGVGNLFSLKSSFAAIGEKAAVTRSEKEISESERIILPGVGAFSDAMKKLSDTGMAEILKKEAAKGKPILGICLGMQLLFDKSFEYGEHEGLGFIDGEIRPISEVITPGLKIPHIGWNALEFRNKTDIFKYINNGDHVYFVHSFYAATQDKNITAVSEYGYPLTASVQKGNIFGCQFHPEKSGNVGLNILKAFCETEAER